MSTFPYNLSRWIIDDSSISLKKKNQNQNKIGTLLYGFKTNHTWYPLFSVWRGSPDERRLMHDFKFKGDIFEVKKVVISSSMNGSGLLY